MWELDCEESWALKNWCFWTVALEKTLESPLDCKKIQPVHSEGDQPWDFFGRNDAQAETPVLWPPHAKSWLIGKNSDAGRDWGQEEKGMTEDEMAGWHHWLDGRESEWTPGVGDGQEGLACCDSWGGRVRHNWATELNWTESQIRKQRYYFAKKDPSSQVYGFSIGYVWMWELDGEESWALKNWCFWTVVLEKTVESPLDCKEIQPVHPKGNQFWVFIGRTDAEAETPILWQPHAKR